MHAPPHGRTRRQLSSTRPPRAAWLAVTGAVVTLLLAACGGGSSQDNGALAGSVPPGQPAGTAPVATLPVTVQSIGDVGYPVVGGTAAAARLNAALLGAARTLTGKGGAPCTVTTVRADTRLMSFRWSCARGAGLTATYLSQTGQRLTLDDLFAPGYLTTLSPTAVTQLELGGLSPAAARAAAPPTAAAFRLWTVDTGSLVVTFETPGKLVTVSFPLPSLTPIIAGGGPLGHP